MARALRVAVAGIAAVLVLRAPPARAAADDAPLARATAEGEPPARAAREAPLASDRGPGYARTTWATLHADSSNSDFAPFATATDVVPRWRALEGAGIVVAPVVASDGRLFVTTGRGAGQASLHALSPDGDVVWETDAVDSGAVLSAPVLDEDGDVYVGDVDEFHAYHPDGRRKWVATLAEYGARGPFVTGIIVGDRVGGITVHGQAMLFERASGALAMPVLELPGGASPLGPVPGFLWRNGLVDPDLRTLLLEALLGYRYEVTNTPAVHPETGRIYLMAAGPTVEEGAFYGIDVVDDDAGAPSMRIAFATPTAPGTGTSPAISPDGRRVYAFGGKGEIFAIDADTGEVVFERAVGGMQASPAVAPDGSVYVMAERWLRKLDGATGDEIWSREYDALARDELPAVSRLWPFVRTGEPVARLDSVVTVTPNAVWAVLLCGYELRIAGRDLVQATRSFLVSIDPRTGALLHARPLPDTSEGVVSVGREGELYVDLLAIQASVAAEAPYRFLLPGALRPPAPRGGIVAFAPAHLREQIGVGLGSAGRLLASAAARPPESEARARPLAQARAQLDATRATMARARERGELGDAEMHDLGAAVDDAVRAASACAAAEPEPDERAECAALGARARTLEAFGGAFHRALGARAARADEEA